MNLKVRHLVATSGRVPDDPYYEPISGVVGTVLGLATVMRSAYNIEIWGWSQKHKAQRMRWGDIGVWTSPEWRWAKFARWDVSWLAPVWRHGLLSSPVDIAHVHVDPNLLLVPGSQARLLHLQTPVPIPFPPAYKRLLRRADAVVCCSEFIREQFLKVSGYPSDLCFTVHNGADLSRFASADGAAQRAAWGFTDEQIILLYAGAIVPEKGVAELIQAFGSIHQAFPQAVLVIAGAARLWTMPGGNPIADAYEAETYRLAKGLPVRFVGSAARGDMPAIYRAADLVVVPSVWDEPFGTVACEAMAAGRPVIASRAGGLSETVVDHETGFLVKPGDIADLARALHAAVADNALRQRLGAGALERASLFSWNVAGQRIQDIYQQLLIKQQGQVPVLHA